VTVDPKKIATLVGKRVPLSPVEQKYALLMSKRTSDTKVRDAMGMDQNALLQLGWAIKRKLGMGDLDSIRDAAKRAGLR